jgi:hypothetical protein
VDFEKKRSKRRADFSSRDFSLDAEAAWPVVLAAFGEAVITDFLVASAIRGAPS